MIVIIVHEIGHTIAAYYYKWNIDKIMLLPFGGLTIFKEDINRPLKEEFIILIMGPLFQILFTLINKNNLEILEISKSILLFNLLPIYPLDGSKIVNILLNKVISFKKSHLMTIYISLITIMFVSNYNLILLLLMIFLLINIFKELKKHHLIFNRFLLERYLNDYHFRKIKTIYDEKDMKRDYRHLFKNKKSLLTEREYLRKRFDFHRKTW